MCDATPLHGSGHEASHSEIPELLLELVGVTAKLHLLLGELDQAEFQQIEARLQVFVQAVAALPQSRPAARKVGFARGGTPGDRKADGVAEA